MMFIIKLTNLCRNHDNPIRIKIKLSFENYSSSFFEYFIYHKTIDIVCVKLFFLVRKYHIIHYKVVYP